MRLIILSVIFGIVIFYWLENRSETQEEKEQRELYELMRTVV